MARVRFARRNVKHDGKLYPPNEAFEVRDEELQELLELGGEVMHAARASATTKAQEEAQGMKTAREILVSKVEQLAVGEEELDAALEEVEQCIKNYCNRSLVPDGLRFTWANMAADILRATPRASGGDSIPANEIASVTVGDVTVTRRRSRSLDDVLLAYNPQLNNFRRPRW